MRHEKMKDLILQYEDLNEDELIQADAHLQECSSCRELLAKIQSAEGLVQELGDFPELPLNPDRAPSARLVGENLRQADNSRRQLLEKVSQIKKTGFLNPLGWGGLGMAMAACLVFFLWAPWQGVEPNLIDELRLTSPQVHRSSGEDFLAAGESYVVRFSPVEAGWPVVVAQNSDGSLKVMHPQRPNSKQVTAGQPVVLPPTGAPFTWRLDDLQTTVWVALSRDTAPDPEILKTELNNLSKPDMVQSYLEERFGSAAVSMISSKGN